MASSFRTSPLVRGGFSERLGSLSLTSPKEEGRENTFDESSLISEENSEFASWRIGINLSKSGLKSGNIRKSTHNVINGCLGDIDRGRTHTAAIRVGEEPQSFDPAVSEWGNPPACLETCSKQR